jgi:superfamily II DNA or RNA helicase
MRGIYVIHDWKPNRPYIHKIGMSDNIGRRKGEYAEHTYEPKFSRIYEINEGYPLRCIETAFHNQLDNIGVKIGTEWFEIEVEKIDKVAIELFEHKFKGALKELHFTDPTKIERPESTSSPSKKQTSIKPIKLKDFTPREDQYKLLDKLTQHYIVEGNTKGQIRLPPGYGKTEIGCCLFPILSNMRRVLTLVPSIQLAQETMKRVQRFHKEKLNINHFKYYEVHSHGQYFDINELNKTNYLFVICVYNSVMKLHDANQFDIIIFDEAHRTSVKSRVNNNFVDSDKEVNNTHFTYAISNDNILATNRLFMTATPRLINNDENSMSNFDKYGEVIYSMTIREAVKKHIINDYKIWMYVKTHNEELSIETDGERFALLLKFIEQCKGMKTLIVCKSIKTCEFIAKRLEKLGLKNVFYVHSQQNKKDNDNAIQKFKNTPITTKSCLCAVNMFKEGIDCPAIDSIVFYDERSSVIDVLQIVGRGLRYKKDVDFTDIGILCSVNPTERLDNQSEMRYLRMIIQNMFDYNEELTNNLTIIKKDDEEIEVFDEMINKVRQELQDNEDTEHFEQYITVHSDVVDYGEKHYIQAKQYAQERCALFNWRVKDDWFDYIKRAILPRDIPRRPDRVYKNMGWTSWDDFLGLNPDKPFDLDTYKYILKNNLLNSNPTEKQYQQLVEKYGDNKVIQPYECSKIYNISFYDILQGVHNPINFISIYHLKVLRKHFSVNNKFGLIEYNRIMEDKEYNSKLPYFPLVYYNIQSLNQL